MHGGQGCGWVSLGREQSCLLVFLLAALCSTQDLISLTRDGTCGPCSGSGVS